jgi:PPOX class probable F420-dependent enzyme
LYLWTSADTGKLKRIRNNPRVNIAPCKRHGEVTGEWVAARASLDETDSAVQHVVDLLRQKMGFEFFLIGNLEILAERIKGVRRVCIKVSLVENETHTGVSSLIAPDVTPMP